MALVSWSPDMSVGVAQFDQHHRKLLDILNKMHDATGAGRAREAVDGLLLELVDYTVYHFLAEEKYFIEHRYPAFAAHKREHDWFTMQLKAARASGGGASAPATLVLLTEWLRTHILKTDRQYAAFCAGRKAA
jgi:hemerythrin